MKRNFFVLMSILGILICLIIISPNVSAAENSGTFGENISWNIDVYGDLIISGTGDMPEVSSAEEIPWFNYKTSIEEVVIGNGITNICNYAFLGCENIEKVSIPYGVKSIGGQAFYGNRSLIQIEIPNSVEVIGRNAFAGCRNMKSVTFSYGLKSIGDYAFYYCPMLESVVIPDTVTQIGERAFGQCGSLKEITLPFVGTELYPANVQDGKLCQIFDGKSEQFQYTSLPESLKKVTVTNQEIIPEGAFADSCYIEEIIIGSKTKEISRTAFSHCLNLKTINISNDNCQIGDHAFASCNNLTTVDLPDNMNTIPDYLFSYCKKLSEIIIPEGVESIGEYAFYRCYELSNINIPDKVTSIGNRAFAECEKLNNINIPDSVETIGDFAFAECLKFEELHIPDSVTYIGNGAFKGCNNITEITLPFVGSGDDATGESAVFGYIFGFSDEYTNENCAQQFYAPSGYHYYLVPDSLKKVTITTDTGLHYGAFDDCSMITEIILSDTLQTINDYVFYNCDGLEGIVIPAGVISIGKNIFERCDNLSEVTFYSKDIAIADGCFDASNVVNLKGYSDSNVYAYAKENNIEFVPLDDETDNIINALIHIKSRPDFMFRYDLTNKNDGDSSPINNDYYLSAYKVTNRQYAEFIEDTGYKAPSYWKNGVYPEGKANHPVLNVSYSDAVKYCEWLSSKYDKWNFRLPTEAEWENAAMGEYYGNESVKYPNGESPSYNPNTGELSTDFNYNGVIASELFNEYGSDYVVTYVKGDFAGTSETLGECISISETGGVSNWANHGSEATKGYFLQTDLYQIISADGGYTTPVDYYEPNSLGLYDMAGNSWDITSSLIVANNGLEQGVECYAVRGGSWYATARSCTFYYRGEGRKDSPSATVGFRIAADYVTEKSPQNIEVSIIDAVTYGDESVTVTITPDSTSQLTDFTFESSNTNVAEISDEGIITIKAAGETDITVKQAGNHKYAAFENTQKLTIAKKAVTVKSVDLTNKTAVLEGVLNSDTSVVINYDMVNIEVVEAIDETTSKVVVSNLVLKGDKSENYIVITGSIEGTVVTDNVVTLTITATNGAVTGAGTYIKGSNVTVVAIPDSGYSFSGWYLSNNAVSTKTTYTFTLNETIELVAKFTKKPTGGGGGGSGAVANPPAKEENDKKEETTQPEPPITSVIPDKPSVEIKFNDVNENDWYFEYVNELAEKGVISGNGNGNFAPNDKVTREQFLKMIMEATDINVAEAENTFDDVADEWYKSYVLKAKNLGIVNGVTDTKFGIGNHITRQDMAVMISRTINKLDVEINKKEVEVFADNAYISDYAKESVTYMKSIGLIEGYNNEFRPLDNLTRAEAAKVISELLKLL